jgi:hypothetical protein
MIEYRNHDPTPEPFVRRHVDATDTRPERTFLHPREGEKSNSCLAVYDGLTATLPHVSVTRCNRAPAHHDPGPDEFPRLCFRLVSVVRLLFVPPSRVPGPSLPETD